MAGGQLPQEAAGAHSMTQPSQDASSRSPELDVLDEAALLDLGSDDQVGFMERVGMLLMRGGGGV
eukprot:13963850-Alexandrium_andersonii.AAC.1